MGDVWEHIMSVLNRLWCGLVEIVNGVVEVKTNLLGKKK